MDYICLLARQIYNECKQNFIKTFNYGLLWTNLHWKFMQLQSFGCYAFKQVQSIFF